MVRHIGAQTPFFYIFRERELIYDLFEAATGMRMMHNYFRIGGVVADLPHERVEGLGITGAEEAVNWGLSRPMLRASGIQWDLRKVDRYECYDEFDWEIQWQKEGDSLARINDPEWNDFAYPFGRPTPNRNCLPETVPWPVGPDTRSFQALPEPSVPRGTRAREVTSDDHSL
ncbi:NAD(P)H-quinone oxidoreductase subunit H, chloroplastic [Sesamum alatum]|uniref:NAD(P)H-quinone oxidoreductase subunit H, chloroplastic n=1 Tax=Sesamum alatum TaxID=300844 RepID=A0AAE1YN67_9LAMI|nr:NAD(P)H-quinone oxidoreductase subunit H, chloroplastic [Sesamum alatum]